MADEAFEDASPQQKINIATYFVMSSPTGEVHDVVKDVTTLVNDPVVLNEQRISSIMREYNVQHMVSAPVLNGDHEALVTTYGQVDESNYLDSRTGKVLTFDHRSQKFIADTDQKQVLKGDISAFRSAIEAEMDAYIKVNYSGGKCVHSVYATDDGKITVCISAKNVRLHAYWTGGWRSKYQFEVSKAGNVELTGSINIDVHYYEDGNVQLHTDHECAKKITISDAKETAVLVHKTIDQIESDFQTNLEELYVNMHHSTFKNLRRFLPLSRQPMNWDANVHALAQEITQ